MEGDLGKTGTVIDYDDNGCLLIEFPVERCADCQCAVSYRGSATVVALEAKSIATSRHRQTAADSVPSTSSLFIGARVELQLSAERLLRVSATLFGLPLLLSLLGCLVATQLHWEAWSTGALQAAGALCGFGLGAGASYRLREQLQTGIYERLAVRPLDC